MYQADIAKLNDAVATLQQTLQDGLVTIDIWDRTMGLPLASLNSNAVAVALFNDLAAELVAFIGDNGVRGGEAMRNSIMVDLENDRMLVIVLFGERLAGGILLDTTKVNLGVVTAMAIPRLVQQVQAAESN